MNYDVIVMVVPEKISILKTSYPYMIKNLGGGLRNIILVANKKTKPLIDEAFGDNDRVVFMDEENIMNGLSLEHIKDILFSICGKDFRAGWFYQQFLKMAYAYISRDEYYLVFDSDTIPLHKIPYFTEEGTPNFITKIEYNKPYFDTIKILFSGQVGRVNPNESFIAENMMISKTLMIEMIDTIMSNNEVGGDTFYEKILNSVDKEFVKYTGFSEFETFGNYVMTYHPDAYRKIKIRTQRMGAFLVGENPNTDQLEWLSNDYDIVSFEPFGRRWLVNYTKKEKNRKKYSAKQLFEKYIRLSNTLDRLMLKRVIQYD